METVLHESPQGAVGLERVAKAEFQATHPVTLSEQVIARALAGVQVVEPTTPIQRFLTGNTKPVRVFSDDDIAFLAPLLSSALARATPDQRVRFRLAHLVSPIAPQVTRGAGVGSSQPVTGLPQAETTAGWLYVHGLSLHVGLEKYRHRAVKPDVISGPNRYYPEQTGLEDRELRFQPESALRPDLFKQTALRDGSPRTMLVIDYQALKSEPVQPHQVSAREATSLPPAASSPPPVGQTPGTKERGAPAEDKPPTPNGGPPETARPSKRTPSHGEDTQALKDLVIKKDLELEALKKELRTLRRQLEERDAQVDALRKRVRPTPQSPDILP
ncbi:hypothetical protein [Candidatus Nitrospira bockiana]